MKLNPLLLTLLLLAPAASASDADGLTAAGAELRNGDVGAELVVLKLLAQADQTPTPGFALNAEAVRVEEDRTDRVVETAAQRTYLFPTTTSRNHTDAKLSGIDNGHEALWSLDGLPGHPAPTVQVWSPCLDVAATARQTETTRAVIHDRDERPDRLSSLSGAMRPMPCDDAPPALVTISGDFLLSLWDWSFSVADASGSRVIETGTRPRSDGTGTEASEAFLFITGGTLTLQLEHASAFYVKGASVAGDELTLRSASGVLQSSDGKRLLDGEDVVLFDVRDTRLSTQGVGGPLQIESPGDVRLSPTTQGPEAPLQTSQTVVTLAGVAAAVALGLVLRQRPVWHEWRNRSRGRDPGSYKAKTRAERRGLGYWIMAKAAHRARRYRTALRYARRAHGLFPEQPEVRLMLAAALDRNEYPSQAVVHYVAAAGMLDTAHRGAEKAQALLGAAITNARVGQHDAAVDWFSELADVDPGLAKQRLGSPALLCLTDNARFRAIRHRLAMPPPADPDMGRADVA